jgi:hypothetical protein
MFSALLAAFWSWMESAEKLRVRVFFLGYSYSLVEKFLLLVYVRFRLMAKKIFRQLKLIIKVTLVGFV